MDALWKENAKFSGKIFRLQSRVASLEMDKNDEKEIVESEQDENDAANTSATELMKAISASQKIRNQWEKFKDSPEEDCSDFDAIEDFGD